MSTDREVIEHGVEIKHIQSDVDTLMEDMEQFLLFPFVLRFVLYL